MKNSSLINRRFLYRMALALICISAILVLTVPGAMAQSADVTPAFQASLVSAGSGEFEPQALMLTPGRNNTEMNIAWYADDTEVNGSVRYGHENFEPGDEEVRAIAKSGMATAGKRWFKATLGGLKPATTYAYIVYNGTKASRQYTFKTSGSGEFTFVAVGDPQLTTGQQDKTSNLFSVDKSTRMGWLETTEAIKRKLGDNIDFIAGVGDQVDLTNPTTDEAVATSEEEYLNFTGPALLRSVPFAPAVGNHDRHYGFLYHYNLPHQQELAPLQSAHFGNETNPMAAAVESSGNYFYTYNNALFVVLNTSGYPTSTAAAQVVVNRFDKIIEKAIEVSPDYDWLFVQHHKSTASVADHIADRDIQYYVEAGLEKLMDKYGVDFVLGGHDHVYARSYPMTGGKPDLTQGGNSVTNPSGTIYMTFTTASGLKYYDLFNAAGNLYVKDNSEYPYLVNGLQGSAEYMKGNLPLSNAKYLQAKKPEFTSIRVTGDTVSFNTYNIDNLRSPIDSLTVTKK